MIRVGQGFDLHRLIPERPFLLGGVHLDWPSGPLGHSDGDVLLHAITDALLGAAGLGDIGQYFPPDDEAYKNAKSLDLLKQVAKHVQGAGFRILNIDTTILLEAPKIGPYREAIQKSIAQALGLSESQVGIKAKTMEGIGPIGHHEAVAAMASVLLEA